MAEHVPDARTWAWTQAWDHLEAATKFQENHPNRDIDETVARIHRAAELYAQLAGMDEQVGAEAAAVLIERQKRDQEHRAMVKNFLKDASDV